MHRIHKGRERNKMKKKNAFKLFHLLTFPIQSKRNVFVKMFSLGMAVGTFLAYFMNIIVCLRPRLQLK